jgi:hypothetical protein
MGAVIMLPLVVMCNIEFTLTGGWNNVFVTAGYETGKLTIHDKTEAVPVITSCHIKKIFGHQISNAPLCQDIIDAKRHNTLCVYPSGMYFVFFIS